jgi:hypothetical protein
MKQSRPCSPTKQPTAAPRKTIAVAFIFVALLGLPCASFAQTLTPVWVELGPDGAARKMTLRQPIPPAFRPACELSIPASAKRAAFNGQPLALPHPNPTKILAFGDTGCRINKATVQDCDDPAKWPFQQIAAQAASENAQLMIHVGDYLYRESPCPPADQSMCGGSPQGDNWDAWKADFFAPAAKLLAAVPWAFTRGNHEDCGRSWRGWFYYLDPRPWSGMCDPYSPPYVIKLGAFELVMLDSSNVKDTVADTDQITEYTGQLLSIHAENAWLVDHHPFWGFAPTLGPLPPIPVSAPLQEAWNKAAPKGISLILSGHIHLFEAIDLGPGHPNQLVIGDGGTQMAAPLQTTIQGLPVRGVTTDMNANQHIWGYGLFQKQSYGWQITLKNSSGSPIVSCKIPGYAESCSPAAR